MPAPAGSSLALLAVAAAAAVASAVAQSVSLTPPANSNSASPLSPVLTPSYAGLGIEPTSLFQFTGTTSRNNLTFQLLTNLANYTGVAPHIRVGGNAGDTMLYNASAPGFVIYNKPNPTGNGYSTQSDALYFGPDYYKAMDYLPKGTPITYGLNLAWQGSGWLDTIVAQANASINGVSNVNIVGFEIGNEPDLYHQNGFRPSSSWGIDTFASEWQEAALAIYNGVLKPLNIGTNFFEPAATATTATSTGEPYEIQYLASSAVAVDDGIYVAGWNQHDYYYYLDVSDYTLTSSHLLDLSTTTSQFKAWKEQSQQAYNTGKPYYLREMGSVGPTGLEGISDTFANTLWTLNFFLYAATLQVASVQMHMTTASYAAPWQPVEVNGTSPHVRSSYYAYAAVDQIIGATCNVRVASLSLDDVPSGYDDRLASYNAYVDGNLQTLVALNTQPAASSESKGTVTFAYSVPSWAGKTVYVSLLTASGSDATTNTTWNGISYESSSTGVPSNVNSGVTTQTVGSDGSLNIAVRDSQAVVVNLGSQIGTTNNVVNATNCGTLASSTSEGNDADPSNTSLAGSGGTAAPTFSTVPKANNPFRGAAAGLVTPNVMVLALMAMALGGSIVVLLP